MLSYQRLSAEVYQLDKPIGCSFGDVEYYAARLAGVSGKILEPAVGTGRILIPLLQQGFDVRGFDASPAMLEICRNNLVAHDYDPELVYQAQFQQFATEQRYEAIIIPTGSFLLLEDDASAIETLAQCFQALTSGGRLILDVFFQHQFKPGTSTVKTFQTAQNQLISLSMTSSDIDYVHQVTTTYHRYDKWDVAGNCIQSEFEIFKLKWFGLAELTRILTQLGFVDVSVSSDYQYLAPVRNQSEIISFEAVKP
ncbi:methyltransferase family protein [Acinetobacter calcoaceticus]|uniref:Methyltransferase family protein n=1 Tax=Acinetobacter calcoaceticus TaxID=471 RepID=A0A4R1XX82_ACICA|nr:methyltransferase family protein [Acinetobacter calcoaceticus]